MLTDVDYGEAIERVLTTGKSTMKILKDLDPLSPSPLKKRPRAGANAKAPIELYARRAAFAACKSRSYWWLLSISRHSKKGSSISLKKNWICSWSRGEKKGFNKNEGKRKKLTKTNIMEVDSIKRAHIK